MVNSIKLLATDLDGTLIGSANELPLYMTFNERVSSLREEGEMVWAACTGRTFRSFWEFFMPMRKFGVMPDYVIIRHAFIFRLTRFGYVPHLVWNISTMLRVFREVREASQAMQAWHSTVVGAALGVRTLAKSSHRLTIRFDSDEAAEVAEELLGVKLNEHKHLQIRRDKTDVEVVMVPATKGTAVAELARHLNLQRENVLAIGNGQNDLSMLDGTYAAMTGCPSNSTYDVMECVHRGRGHIASQKSLSGVLEIIDAHLFGSVDSTLPPEPAGNKSPVLGRSRRRSRSHKHRPSLKRGRILLFGIILYSGLLAFASFDLIPFSHLILKPVQWINTVLVKILSVF